MIELLGHLTNTIVDKLSATFKSILLIAVFVIVAIGGIILWHEATLSQIDRKTQLLKELHGLSKDGVANNPELRPIYEDTVSELQNEKTFSVDGVVRELSGNEKRTVIVLISFICVLFALILLKQRQIAGAIVLIIYGIGSGLAFANLYSLISYPIVPISLWVIFNGGFIYWITKQQSKKPQNSPQANNTENVSHIKSEI